jgi:hypothetical protein
MRELVEKNALASSSLPDYLSDWVNVFSPLCMYTSAQTNKFSELHLQGGGWYLDCAAGFVPVEEKALFASLVGTAPDDIIVSLDEPDIVELPPPPAKAARGKGRAKKTTNQASSQVLTRSASKTPVEPPTLPHSPSIAPSVAPSLAPSIAPSLAPSIAPSLAPSHTPSAFHPQSLDTPSHSGTTLLSLPRKRKAALLDTSATSSDAPNTLSLIENVDMVQLMLDSEVAGGPLPAYTRIQEFIAKVCLLTFVNYQFYFLWFVSFLHFCFLMKLHLQVGAGRSRVNTSSSTHNGLDLLFADVPENLPVPNISIDVPAWNKLHDSYYECLFAFAKSNLYDHGVLVLAHCASASVSRSIFDWAHTYDFYVAEDWFGMNDLDLQSPVVPSGVVINFPSLPLPFCFSFQFQFNFNPISFQFNFIFNIADTEVQHQGSCSC